jgi:CheY-like chemotaxis protein
MQTSDNPLHRAFSGERLEGVEMVIAQAQWRPHFILMDIRRQVMDGYGATRRIRQLPGGDAVKIVALTASVFKEQHEKILKTGCDDVVHKPFQLHELFDTMASLLSVDYLYEGKEKEVTAKHPVKLTRKQLLNLPPELRQELHEAAILLDERGVTEVAEQIAEIESETATALRQLTEHFAFDQILRLLEEEEVNE